MTKDSAKSFFKRVFKESDNDPASAKIFSREEKRTNRRLTKMIGCVCLLGPILMLFKLISESLHANDTNIPNVFQNMEYASLGIYSILTLVLYLVIFSLTIFTKNLSSKYWMKYLYVVVFTIDIFALTFCQGVDVKLGYLVIPLIACLYFDVRFMLITNVIAYFTMVFSIIIRAKTGNVPNYILSPEGIPQGIISNITTADQWCFYSIICMTIEFFVFIMIQMLLIKKASRIVQANSTRAKNIKELQIGLIKGMAAMVDFKESSTGYHLQRVAAYAQVICEELRIQYEKYKNCLSDEDILLISEAAKLHDIGKIAVPDTILTKKQVLTSQEFNIIKQHPLAGYQIIERYLEKYYTDKKFILYAKEIARSHHEWWNGNGYPYGLKGSDIPLCARITSVADVLDSLLSERPYKKAFDIDRAYDIMKNQSGKQFDPEIILILDNIKDKVQTIAHDEEKYVIEDITEILNETQDMPNL
ncbi:MAG: HD domain-containing protein [Treponemataceae bacterium]|nr:HD domain-containing protein [Treponemataceae bacterium]